MKDEVLSDEQIEELYYHVEQANTETPADIKYEFARDCFKAGMDEGIRLTKVAQKKEVVE